MNRLQEIELAELEELFEGSPEEVVEKQKRFVVTNLSELNWVFRKVAAVKKKMAENTELADAERARFDAWEEKENRKYADRMLFLEQKAAEYHRHVLNEDPMQKTISTPYGKSKSTARKSQLKNVKDSKELLAYAEQAGEQFVKVKKEVAWAELKKTISIHETETASLPIDANGEIVPGVIVEPASVSFKVEVNE